LDDFLQPLNLRSTESHRQDSCYLSVVCLFWDDEGVRYPRHFYLALKKTSTWKLFMAA